MSHEWMRPAWETQLGNLPAKTLLVLIADQMNGEGFGWPSADFIVRKTEINERTVRRIMQVFIKIELVTKVDRGPKRTPGIQLNLELLGTDLRARYAEHFRAARGETAGRGKAIRDPEETVSRTAETASRTTETVSRTAETVSRTAPPHPLKGRPLKDSLEDPLKTYTPTSAYAEEPPSEQTCLMIGELEQMPEATGKAQKNSRYVERGREGYTVTTSEAAQPEPDSSYQRAPERVGMVRGV